MSDRHFLVLEERGLLKVDGEDRQTFLQGLVSNDVMKVAPDRAVYASLLTAQGRYLHDFFIADIGGVFYLDAEAARLDDLRRRLNMYRLRAKVVIDAVTDHAVVALFGQDAPSAFNLSAEPGRAIAFATGIVFVDPRLPALGARAIVPAGALTQIGAAGFTQGTRADYERLRIGLGIPDGSRDLPIEKALLLENGFDELNGVDWKKGCYIGQEVTARMKYRSLVRKRLLPVRIDGEAPAPGTAIMVDETEAGEMRSAADGHGLALLRLEVVEKAERDGKNLMAGGVALVPTKPAWMAELPKASS
jgi:folate-binding protein YgfZ